jgi:peptide/nickel transport system substrate-binding protein
LLKKNPLLEVLQIPSGKHFTFPMRSDTKPYDNNDVRLALKYAIDREQLVNKVLRGAGRVANDHPIPNNYRFHNPNLAQRKYDPDKAKYQLKKAGLEGHTFNLHSSEGCYDGAVDAAILYSESAAKAGINIKVVREPADGYWAGVWMQKSWTASYWK